mgnify:CR=1 FL=1
MKVILLCDVKGTGKKDDVLNVSDGFARNYLFPRKWAVEATPGAVKEIERKRANEERLERERREAAQKLADSLRKYSIIAACDENDRGLKAQMKYADKIGAKYSMVLGDDEIASQKAVLKNMKTGEKKTIDLSKDFVEQYVCLSTEQEDLAF